MKKPQDPNQPPEQPRPLQAQAPRPAAAQKPAAGQPGQPGQKPAAGQPTPFAGKAPGQSRGQIPGQPASGHPTAGQPAHLAGKATSQPSGRPAAQPGATGHPSTGHQPAGPQAAGQGRARGPMARPPQAPQRPPVTLPVKPANGTPREIVQYLGAQIQVLATRLESLRDQGAGNTTEFKQLEQMLYACQEKLIMAQQRIERGI